MHNVIYILGRCARENIVARREIDARLKNACEVYIGNLTELVTQDGTNGGGGCYRRPGTRLYEKRFNTRSAYARHFLSFFFILLAYGVRYVTASVGGKCRGIMRNWKARLYDSLGRVSGVAINLSNVRIGRRTWNNARERYSFANLPKFMENRANRRDKARVMSNSFDRNGWNLRQVPATGTSFWRK